MPIVELKGVRIESELDGTLLLETGEEPRSMNGRGPSRAERVEGHFDLALRLTGYPDQLFIHCIPLGRIRFGGHCFKVEGELIRNSEFLEVGGGYCGQYGGDHTCGFGLRNLSRAENEFGKFGAVNDGYVVVDSFEVKFL